MANKSMGEIISTLRKEKGLTQKEVADRLNITDKAVSKWERDLACPDTQTIPKLAEILGVSLEELLNAKSTPSTGHKGADFLLNMVLKAVPLAMGIAVAVLALLGELDTPSGFTLCVCEELTHELLLACSRISCESNTCTAIVTHVTECHHLYVNSCTP